MVKANKERQKEYRKRQRENGMKEVKVWVPSKLVAKLRAYAKKLCK